MKPSEAVVVADSVAVTERLAAFLSDPALAASVPKAEVPALLDEVAQQAARLEILKAVLTARLVMPMGNHREERFLTVEEAAFKLATTEDWLRRHAPTLPFTAKPSNGQLRFSLVGIEDYIRRSCRKDV